MKKARSSFELKQQQREKELEEKRKAREHLRAYVERPNVALAPLRWNLKKLEKEFGAQENTLQDEFQAQIDALKKKQNAEKAKLHRALQKSRERQMAEIGVPPRIRRLQQSEQDLKGFGRHSEAEAVSERLKPLEQQYWANIFKENGFKDRAKRDVDDLDHKLRVRMKKLTDKRDKNIQRIKTQADKEVKVLRRRNRKTTDGIFTIWYAAANNSFDRLEKLRDRPNFRVDERDPDSGQTALALAARNGHEAMVQELFRLGADPNRQDPNGNTPLFAAAAFGSTRIVALMLEAGGDKTMKNSVGEQPSDVARKRLRFDVVKLLEWWNPVGYTVEEVNEIVEERMKSHHDLEQSDLDPAIKMQLVVLQMKENKHGPSHPSLAQTLLKLGALYKRDPTSLDKALQANIRAAQLLLALRAERRAAHQRDAAAAAVAAAGAPAAGHEDGEEEGGEEEDFQLARVLTLVGKDCYEGGGGDGDGGAGLGRAQAAEEWFLEGLRVLRGRRGPAADALREPLLRNLGGVYLRGGRAPEATLALKKYVALREARFAAEGAAGGRCAPAALVGALDLLAAAYRAQGLHRQSVALAERALALHRDHHRFARPEEEEGEGGCGGGGGAAGLAGRLEQLAAAHFAAGEYAAAEARFLEAQRALPPPPPGGRGAGGGEGEKEAARARRLATNLALATIRKAEAAAAAAGVGSAGGR